MGLLSFMISTVKNEGVRIFRVITIGQIYTTAKQIKLEN